jgi:hypothetical protein
MSKFKNVIEIKECTDCDSEINVTYEEFKEAYFKAIKK